MFRILHTALIPFRLVVDVALPPRCPACGVITSADHVFCVQCWQLLDFLGPPACARCGFPFEIDAGPDALCGGCLKSLPDFDGVRAAVAYGDIARRLALKLKHGGRPGIATILARQMRRLVLDAEDALLVPVPLHHWRLWRRGYNQAALIARALARETGLQTFPDMIERHRATPMLRGLSPSERRKAVSGAFAVTGRHAAALAGRSVILVDDVYTTGATADACARVLKRAGAASVKVCCWARAVRRIDNVPPR